MSQNAVYQYRDGSLTLEIDEFNIIYFNPGKDQAKFRKFYGEFMTS
jgi:hypothetical protein